MGRSAFLLFMISFLFMVFIWSTTGGKETTSWSGSQEAYPSDIRTDSPASRSSEDLISNAPLPADYSRNAALGHLPQVVLDEHVDKFLKLSLAQEDSGDVKGAIQNARQAYNIVKESATTPTEHNLRSLEKVSYELTRLLETYDESSSLEARLDIMKKLESFSVHTDYVYQFWVEHCTHAANTLYRREKFDEAFRLITPAYAWCVDVGTNKRYQYHSVMAKALNVYGDIANTSLSSESLALNAYLGAAYHYSQMPTDVISEPYYQEWVTSCFESLICQYAYMGQLSAAINNYEDPDISFDFTPGGSLSIANAYFELGNTTEAIRLYSCLVDNRDDPTSLPATTSLVNAFAACGRLDEAARTMSRLDHITTDSDELRLNGDEELLTQAADILLTQANYRDCIMDVVTGRRLKEKELRLRSKLVLLSGDDWTAKMNLYDSQLTLAYYLRESGDADGTPLGESVLQNVRTLTGDHQNRYLRNLLAEACLSNAENEQLPVQRRHDLAKEGMEIVRSLPEETVYGKFGLARGHAVLGETEKARPYTDALRQAGWASPLFLAFCKEHGL